MTSSAIALGAIEIKLANDSTSSNRRCERVKQKGAQSFYVIEQLHSAKEFPIDTAVRLSETVLGTSLSGEVAPRACI